MAIINNATGKDARYIIRMDPMNDESLFPAHKRMLEEVIKKYNWRYVKNAYDFVTKEHIHGLWVADTCEAGRNAIMEMCMVPDYCHSIALLNWYQLNDSNPDKPFYEVEFIIKDGHEIPTEFGLKNGFHYN